MLDCIGCQIAEHKDNHPLHKVIVNLEGGWVLSHSSESESYLGHLILSTAEHRETWGSLSDREMSNLVPNVQFVERELKNYWLDRFGELIAQVYVLYFNDAPKAIHHFHIHIFPRLASMPEGLAWDIISVQRDLYFNPSYKIYENGAFITDEVDNLMLHLKNLITGYTNDFKSQMLNQTGLPQRNFRSYI